MSFIVKDGTTAQKYFESFGSGTLLDPFSPVINTMPYEVNVVKGLVSGAQQVDKYGRLAGVGTATPPADLWTGGGIYTGFPVGVSETMEIASDNAADTAAGTGARTVVISNLLDASGNLMPEVTVTLNGTTFVSLGAQTYSRCSRIQVKTVGSTGSNVGILTLRHTTTTTNIFAIVPATKNTTTMMCYTVPLGKTLYVSRGNIMMSRASGAAGSANVTIKARENIADAPFVPIRDVEITDSSSYLFENGGFFVFPAMTDFKVTIEAVSDNDTIVSSEYDGYLVDD